MKNALSQSTFTMLKAINTNWNRWLNQSQEKGSNLGTYNIVIFRTDIFDLMTSTSFKIFISKC